MVSGRRTDKTILLNAIGCGVGVSATRIVIEKKSLRELSGPAVLGTIALENKTIEYRGDAFDITLDCVVDRPVLRAVPFKEAVTIINDLRFLRVRKSISNEDFEHALRKIIGKHGDECQRSLYLSN
jgi:hypothetical protein